MANSGKLAGIMRAAAENGIVVPAFNIPYLPMLEPVSATLVKHGTFGLVEVAKLEISKFGSRSIAAVAEEYNRVADTRVTSLHLDHIPVIDEDGLQVDWENLISEGVSQSYSSVMVDGSRLPLEENIRVASRVVEMAHPHGVLVEAELGAIMGHEAGPLPPYEELFAGKRGFTDPDEAREFVLRTGVDWLSVSVGSIHGAISGAARDQAKPAAKLDIEHLRKLRDATGVPLVLHGGSGVQKEYVLEGVRNGIAKINVGTEIRQPYERVLAAGGGVEEAQAAVSAAMTKLICDVYGIEGSASRLDGLIVYASGGQRVRKQTGGDKRWKSVRRSG